MPFSVGQSLLPGGFERMIRRFQLLARLFGLRHPRLELLQLRATRSQRLIDLLLLGNDRFQLVLHLAQRLEMPFSVGQSLLPGGFERMIRRFQLLARLFGLRHPRLELLQLRGSHLPGLLKLFLLQE